MKKIISTLFLTLLFLCISLMNSYASNIIIEKSGENNVKIESVNGVFYLKTDIQLTGYSVNCSGDKLILWGHSKILNESNPQDSLIILFDLTKQIKIKEQGFSKGVFDVNFIKKITQHILIVTLVLLLMSSPAILLLYSKVLILRKMIILSIARKIKAGHMTNIVITSKYFFVCVG